MTLTEDKCTFRPYPRKKSIHSFFEEMAAEFPEKIAVEFQDNSITYSKLDDSADKLATILMEANIKCGDIVAISVERSIAMMIAILAILKAGAAYLPIDTNAPEERKRYFINTAEAKLILSTVDCKTLFDIPNISIEKIPSNILPSLKPQVSSDSLAYVIFTSGSTGKPKGVMVKHHSVVNRLLWMKEHYGFCEDDVFLQKTLYSFDVSVWELFLWFFCGARLRLLESGHEGNVDSLINIINMYGVTACHFVPSMLSAFLEFLAHRGGVERIACLKKIFSSGEALKYKLVMEFNHILTRIYATQLHNLYGPTEATVDVTYFDCTGYQSEDGIIPIGKPIWNTSIYILNVNGEKCLEKEVGEIYISGDGIALGYINNPELTKKVFVPDPFCTDLVMYKTGDLGRWNEGNIEFLGRTDNQVKIHGIRIELEEIENQILGCNHINQSIVIAVGDDDKRLVAYYSGESDVDSSLLTNYLSDKLPKSMIPLEFIFINEFPLKQNGKIDRRELEILYQNKKTLGNECDEIMKVMREIVGRKMNEDDSLSQLSIDSITFIKMVVALENAFDFEFDDEMLLITKFPSVKTMIEYVRSKANIN